LPACKGIHTVIHTVSPPVTSPYPLFYSVNVTGTKQLIEACLQTGVKNLVYTSSASVVFAGFDIKYGEESLPYAKTPIDRYSYTKELAERAVIAANGKSGLKTCALRPSGLFGPRDIQFWPEAIKAGKEGKSKFQIGNGQNIMDWTYIENAALAHVLAAEKLNENAPGVSGEAFFISNDDPTPFWDMLKYIWKELGFQTPRFAIPFNLMWYFALLVDFLAWIVSPIVDWKPSFTFLRVVNAGASRYFNISKAKERLGYQPRVSMEDGKRRTLQYFKQIEEKKKN